MKKKQKIYLLLLAVVLLLFTGGCGEKKEETPVGKEYLVYYLNKEETKIAAKEYTTEETGTVKLTEALLKELCRQPEDVEYKATIPSNLVIRECVIDQTQVIIDFDDAYAELEPAKEILIRASIVKTLTGIPGIEYVSIQVNKRPLKDASGTLAGIMTADMFINNAGTEISTYEKVKLNLYLTNATGNRLIPITRTIVYNSNISMEKLIVEELIKGPANQETYPTINPNTKIVSVTTKDGVCYVNLNEDFLTNVNNATPEVTIYSISNSLVELPNVNKVQILINGENNRTYREIMDLSVIYERNLDLVQ